MYAGAEPCPVVILPIALTTLQGAYYHSDHLGSAELITDCQGREYQWIEYTPYGETWVEKKGDGNYGTQYLPYTFTGKEQDKARTIAGVLCAGLYYYGARYLDPKYSRWISCDPALGEYIPVAPTNDEAKKHNSNLPGNGGVFNAINLHLYHYAGNNPVRYTDPDGRKYGAAAKKIILATTEIVGGVALAGGTGGIGAAVGVGLILDGIGRMGLGFTDLVASTVEAQGKTPAIKSDVIPSSVLGAIGAVIDKKQGKCSSDTGKVGKNQQRGDNINDTLTYAASTFSYLKEVKSNPTPKEALKNEASHLYDTADYSYSMGRQIQNSDEQNKELQR